MPFRRRSNGGAALTFAIRRAEGRGTVVGNGVHRALVFGDNQLVGRRRQTLRSLIHAWVGEGRNGGTDEMRGKARLFVC